MWRNMVFRSINPEDTPLRVMLLPWSQNSSLQNFEQLIFVVYKLPNLWYFVIATYWTKAVWNHLVSPNLSFPGSSVVKNLPTNTGAAGDVGSFPWLERSCGVGNSNPLQYSCLENTMDRAAWHYIVHGVAKSWTPLSMCVCVPKFKSSYFC